ncbi:MAG: hypothetical protein IJ992_02930 [Lentisphaeria bacterium]|nr:hypothetical protein [Lentisphaeria bacterium]
MPMFRRCCASLILTALLSACSSLPETPADAPAQFFFPHGQNGPMVFAGDTLIRAASWTRGDGIEFFSLKDGAPAYTGGLISAGYVMDMLCVKEKFLYLATDYSLLSATGWQQGRPVVLENHLISFPAGGVRKLATDGTFLYATTRDGIRIYRIMPDGRLLFSRLLTEKSTVTAMTATPDGVLFYVTKDAPETLIRFLPDGIGPLQEKVSFRIGGIFSDGKNAFLLNKNRLICAETKKDLLPAGEKIVRVIPRSDRNSLELITETAGEISRKSLSSGELVPLQKLTTADWNGHLAGSGKYLARSAQWIRVLDRAGKVLQIPMVHGEAPVVICAPYVYSVDRQGRNYVLYGFNTEKSQSPDMLPDLTLSWQAPKGPGFRYDIVIPPFAFYNWKDQYLFAPEALLDISDPTAPELVANIKGPAACIVEDSGKIYLAQGNFLSVLDAAKLPDVTPVQTFSKSKAVPLWSDIAVQGDLLYVNGRNKLTIFRIEGGDLKELSTLPLDGNSYKMIRINNLLYFAPYGRNTPFRIVDVKDPAKPFIAAEPEMHRGASILGIKYEDDKLYIADGRTITAYSLEDPLAPKPLITRSGPDKAMQGYNFIDIRDGILAGKKYPRFDIWRIEE